ncbi:hypothetical protein HHI36_006283 [Cryptolaemus montrouzieri]|uniref:Uncharacterized protein n=1 Tax=Cryptolaemus montrouzieri TaxID=559131 RepID=A0ABD2NX21_9CUCU
MYDVRLTIDQPTRPISGTCLDNIITNLEGNSGVIKYHISDHSALKFKLQEVVESKRGNDKIWTRLINDITLSNPSRDLSECQWKDVFSCSPSELYCYLHEINMARRSLTGDELRTLIDEFDSDNEYEIRDEDDWESEDNVEEQIEFPEEIDVEYDSETEIPVNS